MLLNNIGEKNMAQFIVVGNSQGGTGKTSITVLLAEYIRKLTGAKVLVIDADDQHSAEIVRKSDILQFDVVTVSTLAEYNAIDITGYDYIVVDTAPHSHFENLFYEIALDADLLITVVRPAPHDVLAFSKIMKHVLNTVKKDKPSQHQAILLNQVFTTMSNVQKEAISFFEDELSDYLLDTRIMQRAYYSSFGFEQRDDPKAVNEVTALLNELFDKKLSRVQKTKDYCRPVPFSLPESLVKMIEDKMMEVSVEMAKEGIPFKTSQSKVVAEILRHGLSDKRTWETIKKKLKEDCS
jgi:cellulose biosynthesis protein BcsQ